MGYIEDFKDLTPERELEYFDKPTFNKLQEIWQLSYDQGGELFEQQRRIDRRDCLKELQSNNIDPQELFNQFGIANFERYKPEILGENFNNASANLIYMTAYYDYVSGRSGSYHEILDISNEKEFLEKNRLNPKLCFYEMGTKAQFIDQMEKIADPDLPQLVIIRAHADQNNIALGQLNDTDGLVHKRDLQNLSIQFNLKSTIIIDGCEAGRNNGVAQALSKTTNCFVIACDEIITSSAIAQNNHPLFDDANVPLLEYEALFGKPIKRTGIRTFLPTQMATRIYHSGEQF